MSSNKQEESGKGTSHQEGRAAAGSSAREDPRAPPHGPGRPQSAQNTDAKQQRSRGLHATKAGPRGRSARCSVHRRFATGRAMSGKGSYAPGRPGRQPPRAWHGRELA